MSPTSAPTRLAIYCRVSTAEQARDGVSLDMQEARIRDYCRALDLDVVTVIRDEGASAKSLDRPGMRELRTLIDQRKIDGVVVFKLDRLTRSTRDFGDLLEAFEASEVSLLSVKDSLDTSSASGRLVVNIMLSVSQWERETISERTAEALAHAKATGTHLGQAPVGYRVQGGRLVPTDRHRLVVRAHELRAQGLTLKAIGEQLQADGEVTGKGGSVWYPASVSRLLNSPLTVG